MTLLEVVVVAAILIVVVSIAFGVVAQLTRAAADSGSAAAELTLAAKMAEVFRNDARQAKRAACSAKNDSVTLDVGNARIEYLRNSDGRIERRTNGALDFAGPFVFAAIFSLQEKNAAGDAVVRATWNCRADAPGSAGRALVLDTALRAEVEK